MSLMSWPFPHPHTLIKCGRWTMHCTPKISVLSSWLLPKGRSCSTPCTWVHGSLHAHKNFLAELMGPFHTHSLMTPCTWVHGSLYHTLGILPHKCAAPELRLRLFIYLGRALVNCLPSSVQKSTITIFWRILLWAPAVQYNISYNAHL